MGTADGGVEDAEGRVAGAEGGVEDAEGGGAAEGVEASWGLVI